MCHMQCMCIKGGWVGILIDRLDNSTPNIFQWIWMPWFSNFSPTVEGYILSFKQWKTFSFIIAAVTYWDGFECLWSPIFPQQDNSGKGKTMTRLHFVFTQGRFDLGEANLHIKHKIFNLRRKCNINFNLGVGNLYNLNVSVANTTIN